MLQNPLTGEPPVWLWCRSLVGRRPHHAQGLVAVSTYDNLGKSDMIANLGKNILRTRYPI